MPVESAVVLAILGVILVGCLLRAFHPLPPRSDASTVERAAAATAADSSAPDSTRETKPAADGQESGAACPDADDTVAELVAPRESLTLTEKERTSLDAVLGQPEADLDAGLKSKAMVTNPLEVWQSELAGLRAELDGQLTQNKTLCAEIAKLTADAGAASAAVHALQGDKVILNEQIGNLAIRLARVRATLNLRLAGVQAQLEKANAEIRASANVKTGLENQVAELQVRLVKAKAEADERDQSNDANLARLKLELDAAGTSLKASRNAQAVLERLLANVRADLDAARGDAAVALLARTKLETDFQARGLDLTKLRADLDWHVNQNQALFMDNARLSADAAKAWATLEKLHAGKDDLNAQIGILQAQLDKAHRDWNAAQDVIAGLERQLTDKCALLAEARAGFKAWVSAQVGVERQLAEFRIPFGDYALARATVAAELQACDVENHQGCGLIQPVAMPERVVPPSAVETEPQDRIAKDRVPLETVCP